MTPALRSLLIFLLPLGVYALGWWLGRISGEHAGRTYALKALLKAIDEAKKVPAENSNDNGRPNDNRP
jgi:hypothetical protein